MLGMPLNFANIIALPLLLGVGVAFKIYYIMAWRAGQTGLLQSSLTRAVFYSALTTATAFGSLWLSSHPGTSSMGKLLALSLLTTLAAAVLFQPVLMGKPRELATDEAIAERAALLLAVRWLSRAPRPRRRPAGRRRSAPARRALLGRRLLRGRRRRALDRRQRRRVRRRGLHPRPLLRLAQGPYQAALEVQRVLVRQADAGAVHLAVLRIVDLARPLARLLRGARPIRTGMPSSRAALLGRVRIFVVEPPGVFSQATMPHILPPQLSMRMLA